MPIPMSAAQIADDLTDRIKRREYAPGEQLPTYRELMGLYNVGYTTVATVILMLRERGVVVTVPGRGTFVPD
jgi:DNA-binding GntR family transcriptional regulator